MQNCFVPADILLPGAATPLDPWACIAVDQFTSQPEYWQKAEELAKGNPSTLHIVLPEAYLGTPQEESRLAAIRAAMQDYRDNLVAKANELLDRAKSDPEGAKNEAVSILNALGASVSDAKVTVNGNDITISANINGTYVPYSFSNADTHPEIGEAIKNGTWGVAESTTTAAASLKNGNGVIKATGDNAGIAMLVAVVAIAGTMGVAVRKSRDAE